MDKKKRGRRVKESLDARKVSRQRQSKISTGTNRLVPLY